MSNNQYHVPYVNLSLQHREIEGEIIEAVKIVLRSGQYILGESVERFESEFADYCNTDYAIGVNSGTDAIILSLRALGIGKGDEVITAGNSFLASASGIALAGAIPVLVDIDNDLNISPEAIKKAISGKTKAVLPVHLTGRPAKMNEILEIAGNENIKVIEDCAQAAGAQLSGQSVGSFGLSGCFSFHPLKNLSAVGDAGIIVTSDKTLKEQLVLERNHGLVNRDVCSRWCPNSRMDALQAEILRVKLKYLHVWNDMRINNASLYNKFLKGIDGIIDLPVVNDSAVKSVFHTYVIRCEKRDELKQYLAKRGIDTKIHYPVPIYMQPAAEGRFSQENFPEIETSLSQILSLPVFNGLQEDQIYYTAEQIRNFYKN
jgi:dTDP-4-amino-4,6-dideoxygalactose transaminase